MRVIMITPNLIEKRGVGMTDRELLELLVKKIDSLESEVKKEFKAVREEFKEEIKDVRAELKEEIQEVRAEVQDIREEIKQNTVTLETTVKKCIDVIGEGYQANFEKIDRLNLDSMKSKITQLELMQQFTMREIERLKLKTERKNTDKISYS